jgi:hypothetical protein
MLTPTLCVPCKLLKYLTANPSADLTQMPIASDGEEWNSDVVDDGIPCSRAYRMLIHYTTTEPKLDAVAHVLERGCVPNVGPGGGCRVKSKTIWKALDDICLWWVDCLTSWRSFATARWVWSSRSSTWCYRRGARRRRIWKPMPHRRLSRLTVRHLPGGFVMSSENVTCVYQRWHWYYLNSSHVRQRAVLYRGTECWLERLQLRRESAWRAGFAAASRLGCQLRRWNSM